jgi:hypothetical protein
VLVIQVDDKSEGDKAVLKAGDLILEWSRDGETKKIESLFDWKEMVNEKAPRGTIALTGFRADQEISWKLGPREWGLTVEPRPSRRRFFKMETTKNCAITVTRNLLLLPKLTSLADRIY